MKKGPCAPGASECRSPKGYSSALLHQGRLQANRMMSLLSVTVKKARYVGAQASQFNTYATLKLQNVKSTTVTVKGATPCWEQDFLFETNDLNTGLLIEVWSKGMIWDRAMGYHWIPLQTVQYSNEEGNGQWLSLEAELVMRDGEVVGTKSPTGHSLLVDCRFELPFDPENIEASDLQRKLEMLNNIMDQEARMEQARRQMQYFGHSGYSEDSDYTSDLNYPVGQHANSSASQFRSAAHQIQSPQRSLETSRENSYERDDAPGQQHHLPAPATTHQQHLSPGSHRRHHQRFSPGTEDYNYSSTNTGQNIRQYQDNNTDSDPLFYNSRPRNKTDYSSQETWVSCETSIYNQSVDSVDAGYSVDSEYYGSQSSKSKGRRPSLERQSTLYDDSAYYGDSIFYPGDNVAQVNCVNTSSQPFNQNQSCDEFFDSLSYPFQEERYGQDEEDRQWDSGGYQIAPSKFNSKKLPSIPLVQNYLNKRRSSNAFDETYSCYDEPYRSTPTPRRKMPQIPPKRSSSRQSSINDGCRTPDNYSHRGASLPPTPTKTPKMLPRITNMVKAFNSLPPTPGRQLPKPNMNHRSAKARRNNMKRTSSAEYNDNAMDYDNYYMRPGAMSAREMYNEDYNYAYQSIDNLPAQPEELDINQVPVYSDDSRTSAVNSIMTVKNGTLQYQSQSIDDYYYSAQDQDYYNNDVQNSRANKILDNRDNSHLMQNTDSLESRDDEFKDAFDTAVSSINSSLHQLKRVGEVPFSSTNTANTTPANKLQSTTTVSTTQYQRDQQQSPLKAIANITPTIPSVTVVQVQVHNQIPYNNNNKAQNRGFLKQQDSIDASYMTQAPLLNNYISEEESYHEANDGYLEAQESIESYIEEDADTHEISSEYNKQAINHDSSPSSVIHVENYDDSQSLRRGSSQITVVDPYHPSLQRNATDPYAALGSRRSSAAEQFQRRTSGDNYQNSTPNGDDTFLCLTRKPSVVDPYLSAQPRRSSLRVSPTLPEDKNIAEEPHEDELPEKKSVSFEEEEEHKPRPQVTAQQRWLWAYNKIIMQLNVSEPSIKLRN